MSDIEDLRMAVREVLDVSTAEKVIDSIIRNFKGTSVYFPKTEYDPDKSDERNHEIYKMYNGSNMRAVARKFELSSRRIFAIIKVESDKAQKDCFS